MKPKIVVVDDDQELLDELEFILDEEGYRVKTLASVVFTQVIEKIKPDLLIIDVWFGNHQDGVTLAQAVKSARNLQTTPMILMSSDPKVRQYAKKAHADAYIEKPLDINKLLFGIKKILA